MHLTLFSNLTVNSPYIHAPNLIAGFHVKVMPRIFVWIPVPHAQSWSRHCECCLVCLAVLRRHWTQQVQKRRLLFARNHALHPWTLSLCVCMLALVVAVLIAYDYECGRKLSASLFLGSQNQAFLASWLWALIVYIYNIFQMGGKKQPPGKPLLKQNGCFPKSWYPKMDGENHGSNQTLWTNGWFWGVSGIYLPQFLVRATPNGDPLVSTNQPTRPPELAATDHHGYQVTTPPVW